MVEEVISLEEVQVELPEEDILETGVEIYHEEEEEFVNPLDTDHYSNLAESMDKNKLGRIAADLFDKYESDVSS